MFPRLTARAVPCCLLLACAALPAADTDATKLKENTKEIAGTAEFLRSVPKRFAILEACDPVRRQVTLRVEGEKEAKPWPVVPDAEIKVSGWWGRLDQFHAGDRVWVWLETDRARQPVAVSMLADELSEQDIHGDGLPVVARTDTLLTLKLPPGTPWKLTLNGAKFYRGKSKAAAADFKPEEKVYVASRAEPGVFQARLVLDREAFEARRAEQRAALRKRWTDEGLPGTVTFLHIFSGEMEAMLDHEAQRWGRSLRPGVKVTLVQSPAEGGKGSAPVPIPAVVREVRPWRERTQVRLVVNGVDQADLAIGQRVFLRMPPLSVEADSALLPPDLDRPRSKEERLDWFLATVYCTCKVRGDVCTGQFYTLASCNPNACGMPHGMRRTLAEKIDKGMTDRQILEELLKEDGPDLLRPHLSP